MTCARCQADLFKAENQVCVACFADARAEIGQVMHLGGVVNFRLWWEPFREAMLRPHLPRRQWSMTALDRAIWEALA